MAVHATVRRVVPIDEATTDQQLSPLVLVDHLVARESVTDRKGRGPACRTLIGIAATDKEMIDADLSRRKLFVAHRALTTVRVERADRGASTRRIRRLVTPMVTDATTPAATGMIIGEASAAIDVAEPSPPVAPIAIRPAVSPVVAVAVAIVVAAEIPASAPRLFTKQAALISPERSCCASRTPPMVALIAAPATVAREVTRPRLAAAVPRLLIAVRPAVARVSTVARVWLDAATVIRPFATRTAFVI